MFKLKSHAYIDRGLIRFMVCDCGCIAIGRIDGIHKPERYSMAIDCNNH